MQTRHGFDEQLREVRTNVLRLAALAREAVTAATEALLAGEAGTVEAVLRVDEEIDDLVSHLETQCFEMMARQQPMASDLRTLVAVLRVIHELELTGDLMTSVATATSRLRVTTLNPRLRGILARIGSQVSEQLRLAALAFDESDIGAVEELEHLDDGMSEMSRELFAVLFDLGTAEPDALRRAVDLALVARFFQRAADHAVNVGARVRYMVMGEMPAPHPVRDVVGLMEPVAALPERSPQSQPDGEAAYINRELSWLDFNGRVLALACDPAVPLLERVKFLAIYSENLDEFFQVRVAGIKDQQAAGLRAISPDGLTPTQQLKAIRARVAEQVETQITTFLHDVVPALAGSGIVLSDWATLDDDDRDHMDRVFANRIFPVLTPLAVDPGHPFPYISSMSLNLAVSLRNPASGERRFARVKVPPILPRFVVMPDGERFVPLEQVIAAHLDVLFPGIDVEASWAFRVTRNADLALEEEEADDLLLAVELELRRRRFGRAVRLEVEAGMPVEVEELLSRELELGADDVYRLPGPLELAGLWAVYDLDLPELKYEPWIPVTQPALAGVDEPLDIFSILRERDIIVHHPYDSFTTSVEAFVHQAATDPRVLAIKMTLYRTSGDSPIVKSLIEAAERGKQVVALVEVKARFDEQANIAWARALEEAGVHVVYGLLGLKTHTKTCLAVRDEGEGMRRYCHVGTGNYNSKTARIYEDVGLLTSDPDVGADLSDLFNYLTGYSRLVRYRKMLVAPITLRDAILDLIREQRTAPAGTGRIVMKMNSLVDQVMIDALYDASRAGVQVDLIVRGICCLRPGVPGLSDNIRVRSIVGRHLEHSRIFAFGARDDRRYYIGSADLMPRNLDRRVEAVAPVEDPELQSRLQEVLDINLADDTLAWELGPDGAWQKIKGGEQVSTHEALQRRATERARRGREPTRLRRVESPPEHA